MLAFEERLPLHALPESDGKSDENDSCQTPKERGLPFGAANIYERERADYKDVQGEEHNGDQPEGVASYFGFLGSRFHEWPGKNRAKVATFRWVRIYSRKRHLPGASEFNDQKSITAHAPRPATGRPVE